MMAAKPEPFKLLKITLRCLSSAHKRSLSRRAKLVKLADKICNLRDVTNNPPADWPLERRQAYLDWAKAVVGGLRDAHPGLAHIYDEAYKLRP